MTYGLTDRQLEIMKCISQGLDNKCISQDLGISVSMVKSHICRIMTKFNVRTRVELGIIALAMQQESLK